MIADLWFKKSSIFCSSQDQNIKQAEIETTVHYNHVTAINSQMGFFLSSTSTLWTAGRPVILNHVI